MSNNGRFLARSGVAVFLVAGLAACNPFAGQQPQQQPQAQQVGMAQPAGTTWQDPKAAGTGAQAGMDWDDDNNDNDNDDG